MSLTRAPAKQVQEFILLRKSNKIIHPLLFFNNVTSKLARKQKHLGLQLDRKLSFEEHTINKISKATKGIEFLRKLQLISLRRSFLMIYKSFVRPQLDYIDVIYEH